MCGIIAIARQKSSRIPPSAEGVIQSAELSNLGRIQSHEDILRCVQKLLKIKELISGAAGINALITDPQFRVYLQGICSTLSEDLENFESELVKTGMDSQKLEEIKLFQDWVSIQEFLLQFRISSFEQMLVLFELFVHESIQLIAVTKINKLEC